MELTRFQKCLLAALAGMLVLFSVLLAVLRARPGVTFEGGLLKIAQYEGRTVYSGKVRGMPVMIAVTWPTNFETDVEFTIGAEIYDVCRVLYPTERIQTERGDSVGGILVTKNGETLFEGGYDPDMELGWYDGSGQWIPNFHVYVQSGGDPWRDFEITKEAAVRFAFGPETAARGDPALFSLAVFFSLLLAAEVVFHRALFRWRHWAAKDPEPSEAYLTLERVCWIAAAAGIGAVYIAAMTAIY